MRDKNAQFSRRIVLLLLTFAVFFVPVCTASGAILTEVQVFKDFLQTATDPFSASGSSLEQPRFIKPLFISAVAARHNHIFFIDSGRSRIYFLDSLSKTISEFAVLKGGETRGLFIAQDLSLFVVDRFDRAVLHYSRDGRLLGRIERDDVLVNPIDVIQNEPHNDVVIADSFGAYLVEFNILGGLRSLIGQNINQATAPANIVAITAGHGRYYLLDGLSRSVTVMNRNGETLDTIGRGVLKQPVSLATDMCGRIFVADQFDNALHIFTPDGLMASLSNERPGLTGFSLITDIWVDENFLYVADGPTAKIKKYLIDIDC